MAMHFSEKVFFTPLSSSEQTETKVNSWQNWFLLCAYDNITLSWVTKHRQMLEAIDKRRIFDKKKPKENICNNWIYSHCNWWVCLQIEDDFNKELIPFIAIQNETGRDQGSIKWNLCDDGERWSFYMQLFACNKLCHIQKVCLLTHYHTSAKKTTNLVVVVHKRIVFASFLSLLYAHVCNRSTSKEYTTKTHTKYLYLFCYLFGHCLQF